ncbi:unnamed protein product, partial [Mesorhabditis spiculigera]
MSVEAVDSVGAACKLYDIPEAAANVAQNSKKLPASPFDENADRGFLGHIYQRWQDHLLLKRISNFETIELKTFVGQKLFKIDGILCDERSRTALLEKLLLDPGILSCDLQREEMVKKHGERMVSWLQDRLLASLGNWDELLNMAAEDFQEFRLRDPLCNWYRSSPETTLLTVQRIQTLSERIYEKVRWSLLIEPGKLTCHLMDFISEFNRLDTFFANNELTPEEADQSAFNQNHLTKARSSLVPCSEMSRVRLRPLLDQNGEICWEDPRFRRSRIVQQLFNSDQVPEVASDDRSYGTTDFIHANYVRGGPLRNTFICTQAPLAATQEDFWRMVYQEKSALIFMLCAAVEESSLGRMANGREFCPYYWPRFENQELMFGNLIVRNCGIDSAKDPLFTVTYLEVWRVDDARREEVLALEHWQWDWTTQVDTHWPFRVLRRSRTSPTPTIVHCMDGAGRTGALITLEVVLMHLLSGFAYEANPVLMAAVFVRLQRRGSIATPLLYLWVYRCLLHWISPFVTGWRARLSLGLVFRSTGFISKYNDYLRDHTHLPVPF